ncbi:hypothetical protein AAE02nite_05390 [Adhaeribacter aerolatus]|uniref:Uncharacterized protein n=1 Tax=Adhaeribacter aerolatus TaxID=670289 RepID=A0A512AT34_9BACT|nr:twin-arginine translocation signal domain-containing protein [Adhaeribacter aerolatus]GEO02875.1 hypothetical protein AAE02nite_05390 [Adhaeribacter aerolatus]
MKENRRDFIRRSASLAAALSVGGVNTAFADTLAQNVKVNSELKSIDKDAGMEMGSAYFYGIEANK